MTNEQLLELIKTVSRCPIQRFEFCEETTKIVIERLGSTITTNEDDINTITTNEDQVIETIRETNMLEIVSPMVGTYYSASEQGSPPYVQIGQTIQSDTVICVLEAMKMYTEITAKVSGEIVEIIVNDGQLVQYGDVLFRVKPL